MLIEPYSWRLFFYVATALAGALFVVTFLFVEESSYDRRPSAPAVHGPVDAASRSSDPDAAEKPVATLHERAPPPSSAAVVPLPRKSYRETLSVLGRRDPHARFFMTIAMSFTYFLVPQVLWVILSFGIYIGMGAFAFNYTFPIKIVAPPYNWSVVGSLLVFSPPPRHRPRASRLI